MFSREYATTKTPKSHRTLALPAVAVAALKKHRAAQAAERLALGDAWAYPDLVFTTTIGTPLGKSDFIRRSFKAILRRPGFPIFVSMTCGTRRPPSFWRQARTCGPSRRCLATRGSGQPRTSTRTYSPSNRGKPRAGWMPYLPSLGQTDHDSDWPKRGVCPWLECHRNSRHAEPAGRDRRRRGRQSTVRTPFLDCFRGPRSGLFNRGATA